MKIQESYQEQRVKKIMRGISMIMTLFSLTLLSFSINFLISSPLQTTFAQLSSPSPAASLNEGGGNSQLAELEAARQQYLQVWNQTEFHIPFSTFIEPGSATGYGVYEEHEGNNNIFRQGETIELYAEPAAFGHQPIIDASNTQSANNSTNSRTLYSTGNTTVDIIIYDSSGNELATTNLSGASLISHRQTTEFPLEVALSQESPFPVGDYIISYVVHDQVKGESFQIDKRITIANEDDATTADPSASDTITGTQFQMPSESISTTTNGGTTENNNNQAMDLEAARQQYLQVWNQTEFHIPFSTFIEPGSATGYGVYEEHEGNNNIFRQGETIQLYTEPAAFGHQQISGDNGNTLYLMNFSADTTIAYANNGSELVTLEDVPIGSIISHRQNTEEHVELTLTQSRPLPVGDYIITYTVHDHVKGESFPIDKRITITAAEDDNIDTATTIQEEQQQQQLQEVDWLQYENATHGIRMLYPSDWMQQDGTIIDDGFISVSNFYSPEEADYATVVVGIDNTLPSTNLEDNLNYTINSYMQDPILRDFQVLSSTTDDFTVAGMPAYALEASYIDPEFGLQYLLVVETILDNKGYSISYFADRPVYQTYFPIVERMIESFEIMLQQQ